MLYNFFSELHRWLPDEASPCGKLSPLKKSKVFLCQGPKVGVQRRSSIACVLCDMCGAHIHARVCGHTHTHTHVWWLGMGGRMGCVGEEPPSATVPGDGGELVCVIMCEVVSVVRVVRVCGFVSVCDFASVCGGRASCS